MTRLDDGADGARIPRRTFLAGLVAAVAAMVAAIALPRRPAARPAAGSGAALRPLTRGDLYREHDLAG
jgi:hypothetical protein